MECVHCNSRWYSADLVCIDCGLVLDCAIGEPGVTLPPPPNDRTTSRKALRAELRNVSCELGVEVEQSALMIISETIWAIHLPRRNVATVLIYLHLKEIPLTYIIRKMGFESSELRPALREFTVDINEPISKLVNFALTRCELPLCLWKICTAAVEMDLSSSRDLTVAAVLSKLVGAPRVSYELCLSIEAVKRACLRVQTDDSLLRLGCLLR
jgi:hypothetical protein